MGKKALGSLFRAIRTERGISYYGLGEKLGVTGQHVNMIENGKAFPSLPLACEITREIGADPRDVYYAVLQKEDGEG